MLKGKVIKNVFPYFNKIITETQKQISAVEVKAMKNQLIFNLIGISDISINYIIDNDGEDFDGLLFEYEALYAVFKKIKAKDDISFKPNQNILTISINGEDTSLISKINNESNESNEKSKAKLLYETTEYNLFKCIEENKVLAESGSMDYNANIYFDVDDNVLNIYNTNDIAMSLNKIYIDENKNKCSFAISNEYISILYKWINSIKNLKVQILLSDEFVFFKTRNEFLKLKRVLSYNDKIIENFEVISNMEFPIIDKVKIYEVKKNILDEANVLDKDEEVLKLSKNFFNKGNDIKLNKKLFIKIINAVCEESIIGIVDNPIKPIIILYQEEGINHKIIFNTIN